MHVSQHEVTALEVTDEDFLVASLIERSPKTMMINPKGNKVRLTEKETSILRYLLQSWNWHAIRRLSEEKKGIELREPLARRPARS